MNPNLAPLLRPDLNPAYLGEENGILRYLNPADLAGDNGKYNKLYDRLAPLYNLGEWLARLKYGGGIAKMRREMLARRGKGKINLAVSGFSDGVLAAEWAGRYVVLAA